MVSLPVSVLVVESNVLSLGTMLPDENTGRAGAPVGGSAVHATVRRAAKARRSVRSRSMVISRNG